MSVVIETTLGDITVDLFLYDRPRACLNFLKLCKIKYYTFNLFHTISRGFIAQTGDPTGSRTKGESIFGIIDGPSKRYFEAENEPRIKHTCPGLLSFVGNEDNMIASQFFLTLGDDLTYLDEKHCVFGKVVEGFDILESINEVICDNDDRPYQDVRITHTVVLDDPYPDPKGIEIPSRSPSPSAIRLAGGRIAPDEEIDETLGKSTKEVVEMQAEREAKARAHILEMIGDIPDAEMAPPENVLFVCKLNPITNDDDLEIIFSRFGKIKSCEVIRDRKSGDSLQYAFIEFEDQKACEEAYFKMDNVLVDDRRMHVDFSQSVSKVKWLGKGRGVTYFDEKGNKKKTDFNSEIGKGDYKFKNSSNYPSINKEPARKQDRSPKTKNNAEGRSAKRLNQREVSRSPKKRSPGRFQERNKSPSHRRHSKSPKHRRNSRTPIRESRSPVGRKRYSGSPDYAARITNKRYYSSRKRYESHESTSRRNTKTDSPQRKSNSRRSRSPRKSSKSPNLGRKNHSGNKQSRSPRRKSRSPRRKIQSPVRLSSPEEISKSSKKSSEEEKKLYKDKKILPKESSRSTSPKRYKSSRERSKSQETEQRSRKRRNDFDLSDERFKSPKKQKNISSSRNRSQSPATSNSKNTAGFNKFKELSEKRDTKIVSESRDRESKGNKLSEEKFSLDKKISKERTVKKVKTRVGSSKRKSKKYNSSEKSDTDSEEDRRKSKKKKSKKKVESSTESSSEESSSTSEEEIVKRKANKTKSKRNLKEKKSKKTKRRKSSSSSSSTSSSDSESTDSSSSSSSSSSSESDIQRKKKSKKKRTKGSSESE